MAMGESLTLTYLQKHIHTSDFIYKNIFQLRKHKLEIMKQIIDAVPRNVKIVRLHELERSPEILIQVRILMPAYMLNKLNHMESHNFFSIVIGCMSEPSS